MAPSNRFQKLSEPVFLAFQAQKNLDVNAPGEIWPQIPFAGSLIITLAPIKDPQYFKLFHGFEIGDIPRLVDFARDTGKVQFMLLCSAKNYAGLDFFHNIFTEFKPPIYGHIAPQSLFSDKRKVEQFRKEFVQVAHSSSWLYFDDFFDDVDPEKKLGENTHIDMARQSFDNRWEDYLLLRALGKDAIADEILCLFTADPTKARIKLYAYHKFLFEPLLESRPHNIPLSMYKFYGKNIEDSDRSAFVPKFDFPLEIGTFLMKKLTPYAPSFKAMEYMVETHKQQDLYNVMGSLCKAVKSRSPDQLIEKAENIGEILECIWKDSSRIKKEMKDINCGFSLTFGLIGPLVGFLSTGYLGLLAGMGFSVAQAGLDWYGPIGQRLIKKLRPNHLTNIYDFQVKYKIE